MTITKTLYAYVSNDKYETPLIICDSVSELTKFKGVKPHTISVCSSREQTRYKRITVEFTEEEAIACGIELPKKKEKKGHRKNGLWF